MNTRLLKISSVCICISVVTGCKTTSPSDLLNNLGFPAPAETNESGTGKKVAGGLTGCAVGGAAGYFGTKALKSSLEKYGYTGDDIEKAAVVVGALGCIVGGKIAIEIIQNMDEKSKRAQEEAWVKAQSQARAQTTTAPQAWKTDTHEGTVEILEPVTNSDGQECATRKNYIKTAQGEAEQFIPVCKNSSGTYEQVET